MEALITAETAEQQTFQIIILYSEDSPKLNPQAFNNTDEETKIKPKSN